MQLKWTELAVNDLDQIEIFIAQEAGSNAAIDMIMRIIDIGEKILLNYPEAGRSGRVTDTRELVIAGTPFILVYRHRQQLAQLQILRVLHAALQWPAQTRFN